MAFALQLKKKHGKTSVRVAIHKHSVDDDPSVWKLTVSQQRHTCIWYAKVLQVIAAHRPFNYTSTILSIVYVANLRQVSQLKKNFFLVIGIERNVCRCTFNRCSVITQFAKLAVV
jgi:hypothetical protein